MKIENRGRPWGREGQALAEFALIMPVLFLLIAGIIEFGRGWNIKQAVTDAAREGARYTVIQDPTITDTSVVAAKIRQRLLLAGINSSTISITPVASFHSTGTAMTVVVATQFNLSWVGALLGWLGANSTITIASTTTMRNE
jgi:Flp pilus assembly protein TadG